MKHDKEVGTEFLRRVSIGMTMCGLVGSFTAQGFGRADKFRGAMDPCTLGVHVVEEGTAVWFLGRSVRLIGIGWLLL